MDIKEFEKSIMLEMAQKVMESLPDEKKQELILVAVTNQLERADFKHTVSRLFGQYAEDYAATLLENSEIQGKIKESVKETVDEVFSNLRLDLKRHVTDKIKWAAERAGR